MATSLDAWLDSDGPPFAILLGPVGAGKAALLARWALSVAERGTVEVAFLPVDRRLGTVLERDALRLLAGMFLDDGDEIAPRRLRHDVRDELWCDRRPDELPRLVIVTGIDCAEGWSLPPHVRGYPEPGERVRILVSADIKGECVDRSISEAICTQQGWAPSETEVFTLHSTAAHEARVAANERIREIRAILAEDDVARRAILCGSLALLACAFQPLCLKDLGVFLGQPENLVLRELAGTWGVLSDLLERSNEHTGYRFRHELFRQIWQLADQQSTQPWERRILDSGREVLEAIETGRLSKNEVTPYLVNNFGAHLTRSGASVEDFLKLVDPAWLRIWRTRDDAASGFLADVGRARDRAEGELRAPSPEMMEAGSLCASVLTAVVRCVIVEGSIVSINRANETLLLAGVGERFDWSRPTGHGVYRVEALVALAAAIELPGRDQVLDLAYDVTRREPDCVRNGGLMVELAAALTGPRREELAREAIGVFRAEPEDEREFHRSTRGLLVAAALLPPRDGLALAIDAVEREFVGNSTARRSVRADPGVVAHAAAGLSDALLLGIARASTCLDDESRMTLLGRLAFLLSPWQRSGVVSEVGMLYADYFDRLDLTNTLCPSHVVDFAALAPLLPESAVTRVLPAVVARLKREVDHGANLNDFLRLGHHLRGAERDVLSAEMRARASRPQEWLYSLNNCPSEVCELLGPEGAVDLLKRIQQIDPDFDFIESAARLAPELPPGLREDLVARVAEAQADHGDNETVAWVFPCVKWMTTSDRVRLFCAPSTNDGCSLYFVLNSRGGWLPRRAELLRILGGEAAVLGAAREIAEVATWLP